MKMTKEHFEGLSKLIGMFPREDLGHGKAYYQREGLSARRYCWDVLWSVPADLRSAWFDTGVYDYLNDDHIDTALKTILKADW